MKREGASVSLHRRLTAAVARGAQAQEDSRALVETMQGARARLQATVADGRARRAARAAARRPP